jgi:hypothetical protein
MNMTEVYSLVESVPPEIDLLVVPGKNLGAGSARHDIRDDNYNLSTDSRINTIAAGMLWVPGRVIVLSGAQTAGRDIQSQPSAAREYLMRKFPDIPFDDILLEESGVHTAKSAQAVAELLKDKDYRHVGLVGLDYTGHLNNSATLFEHYGVNLAAKIAAEGIISQRSAHHEAFIEAWRGSHRIQREIMKEKMRQHILNVDQGGRLLGLLASIARR